ncbi:MAG: hypothetical protein ACXWV0_00540 [Flavisolibacter sp.]
MDENLPLDDELLVHYLDGTISEEEKLALEERLKIDPELLKSLEHLHATRLAVQMAGTAQQVRSLHQEMMKEIKHPVSTGKLVGINRKLFYFIGAVACVIIIFFIPRIFKTSAPDPDELYQQAFVDYTFSANRGAQQNSRLAVLYQQQQYDSVVSMDHVVIDQHDSLLFGISALKLSETKKSIEWLGLISAGSLYYQDAEYYQALAYLKDRQYAKALVRMRAIEADPGHMYHQKITKGLIGKVESLKD